MGGIDKLIAILDRVPMEFTKETVIRMQQKTPVRSGRLRNGYCIVDSNGQISIVNNVPYAGYVEYGTIKQAPAAFVRTTIKETKDILKVALQRSQ